MDVLGMVQSEPSKFTFGESFTLIALSFRTSKQTHGENPPLGA